MNEQSSDCAVRLCEEFVYVCCDYEWYTTSCRTGNTLTAAAGSWVLMTAGEDTASESGGQEQYKYT